MKVSSLRIQNFRSFKDQTINFDDYTCFVGANGSGKSTILTALNLFFRETADSKTDLLKLSKEDFHNGNVSEPVQITVTFADLSVEAQEDFKAYFRHGKLAISAVANWDADSECAAVVQHGERLGIAAFKQYYEKEKAGASADELKKFFKETLCTQFQGLPLAAAKTKPAMVEALQAYEIEHHGQCTLLLSKDDTEYRKVPTAFKNMCSGYTFRR